jgi:hypothetical protein
MTDDTDQRPPLVQGGPGTTGRRLVLLSGRGEDEALADERIVMGDGADRALGRPPRDLTDVAGHAAATGIRTSGHAR